VELVPLGLTIIITHLGLLFWELRHISSSLAFPGLKPQATPNPYLPVADDASDLCCADGTVYRFEEIVRLCASTSRGNWAQAISGHLDALLAVRSEPRVDEMTAAELETQVRARVLPTASITASTTDLSYARPLTDDLCVVLCVERHRASYPGRATRIGFRPPGTMADDAPTTRFAPLTKPGSSAKAVLVDEPRTDRFPAAHAIPTNPFRVISLTATPDDHDDVMYLDAAQVAVGGAVAHEEH
jgi:hypothetical protein